MYAVRVLLSVVAFLIAIVMIVVDVLYLFSLNKHTKGLSFHQADGIVRSITNKSFLLRGILCALSFAILPCMNWTGLAEVMEKDMMIRYMEVCIVGAAVLSIGIFVSVRTICLKKIDSQTVSAYSKRSGAFDLLFFLSLGVAVATTAGWLPPLLGI